MTALPNDVLSKLDGRTLESMAAVVEYKNWKGDIATRIILPLEIFYGRTDQHPEDQWLMRVWDLEKNNYRTYAMRGIQKWNR